MNLDNIKVQLTQDCSRDISEVESLVDKYRERAKRIFGVCSWKLVDFDGTESELDDVLADGLYPLAIYAGQTLYELSDRTNYTLRKRRISISANWRRSSFIREILENGVVETTNGTIYILLKDWRN